MKKILLVSAILFGVLSASAATWRVNYDESANADFRTLAAACASSRFTNGDIIYVEPGYHDGSSEDNTITRPCTIIGTGWGFRDDAGLISSYTTSKFSHRIIVRSDSVTIQGIYTLEDIQIYMYGGTRKKVTIERCRTEGSIYTYDGGYGVFHNIIIRNNYCAGISAVGARADFISIIGNIVLGRIETQENTESTLVDHNTIVYYGNYDTQRCIVNNGINTVISNNIIINTHPYYPYNICNFDISYPITNNVMSMTAAYVATQTEEGNTVYSVLNTNHYVGATVANTFSGQATAEIFDPAMVYRVAENSVAKTGDANGGECGAFGGEYPYVLCGRPNGVPYLYDINVPEKPTDNQLNITFKVGSQNQ